MSEAPEQAPPHPPLNPDAMRHTADEDRAWAQLYASVGQAATAEEIVRQLEADVDARRSHLALYLRAKATLRERRTATLRHQRLVALVRSAATVVATLAASTFRLLRSLLAAGHGVAWTMRPAAGPDPARRRIGALTRNPEFAKAAERFTATADGATPIAGPHEASRSAKAA